MPLSYAFVARGDGTVLAEHSKFKGNTGQVARECLKHVLSSADGRMTLKCDKHTFNFLRADGWVFLAVADEDFGRQVPFAYLSRVQSMWQGGPAAKALKAGPLSLNRSFGKSLGEAMDQVNANPESVNKTAAVQKQVDDVKSVMVQNIEQVLNRGEKMQVLVDRTEDLQMQAQQFQKQGRKLRSKMCWDNVKVKAAVACGVLLLLAVIVLVACFAGGNRCVKKGQEHHTYNQQQPHQASPNHSQQSQQASPNHSQQNQQASPNHSEWNQLAPSNGQQWNQKP